MGHMAYFSRDESEEHQRYHLSCLHSVEEHIAVYRIMLGIEEAWVIEPRVLCPIDMPDHEGSIWWDEHCWYVRLMVRCDLLDSLQEWIIVHELLELQDWRQASLALTMLSFIEDARMREHLEGEYRKARDQGIEQRVRKVLGFHRPYHLAAPIASEGGPIIREKPVLSIGAGEEHVV